MSIIRRWLSQLFAALLTPDRVPADPDGMPVRDWADLPAYHPLGDNTPC